MNVGAAISLAVGAAGLFAISAVLQQRAAQSAPAKDSLSWRLMVDLVRRPSWLAGMGCVILAFLLQAGALKFGPVALVEPLITTELVLALPLASHLRRRRLGRREWLGDCGVAGGVSLILAVSSPHGGSAEPPLWHWGTVAVPVIAVAGLVITAARGPESPRRAALLATSAGLCFALLALITQSFVVLLSQGASAAFSTWQPYVVACLGLGAFTIAQSAYQAGPLAVSLPIIDALEPIASVAFASLVFRQGLATNAGALGLEGLGAVLSASGLVLLATSPLVLSIYEQQQQSKP